MPPIEPVAGLVHRTVTFLFTDIEESSVLWEERPEAMRAALPRHDALLRRLIEARGGTVFKTVGDAFCAAFDDAPDAVEAAVSVQREMRAADWGAVGGLRVRVALHTGEADQRDGDFFGPSLSRVARVLAAAHGGQTLLSGAAAAAAGRYLPAGVSLRDLGVHRLRSLARPVQIFQVVDAEAPGDFPPLRAVQAFAHNLPLQLTSFIGRDRERGEVRRLLAGARLVTLIGPGGCGKTRLAQQTAEELVGQFPDGVWEVELAPLADGALLPRAVAAVLNVREDRERAMADALVDALRGKELLLFLDNCEHLVTDAARLVERLLRECPRVRILATSREPLGVPGEVPWPLPPMAVPPVPGPGRGAPRTPEQALRYESVRLFAERAAAAHPGFALTEAAVPAVSQICRRLDGIPLAIELAAARVRALPPAQMAARLDDCFRILTGGARTAMPRQQTLHAAIDWSHGLLTDSERALLRRLAVFTGGFTLEAAEAVTPDVPHGDFPDGVSAQETDRGCLLLGQGDEGPGLEEWEVLDTLARLVDRSLVMAEAGPDGEARYRLLETIRQYAREKLCRAGEADVLGRRHARYYAALGARAEPELLGAEQSVWLARLEAEHDNFRAALRAVDGGKLSPEAGLALAADLWRFWYVRGYLAEGCEWLAGMLDRAPGAEGPMRARALTGAGNVACALGRLAEARGWHEEALRLRDEAGDRRGIASSLSNLGNLARFEGDLERSRERFEASLQIYRELGDRKHTAMVLGNLSANAIEREAYESARVYLEECLELHAHLGDAFNQARALHNLGMVSMRQGDLLHARECLLRSLHIKHQLLDHHGCASTVETIARLHLDEGNCTAAAWLMGAVEGLLQSVAAVTPPTQAARLAVDAERCAAGLLPGEYERLWNEGFSAGLDETVARAVEGLSTDSREN